MVKLPKLEAGEEDAIRQYLLGGEFPPTLLLQLAILKDHNLWTTFFFPYGDTTANAPLTLPYLGFLFSLWIQGWASKGLRQKAFFPSAENLIVMSDVADEMFIRHAGKRMEFSKLVGRIKVGQQRKKIREI